MYSSFELVMLVLGAFFWLWYYVILVRNSFKEKFVEMPVAAACGNIAWELTWGFVFKTEMGMLITYSYRAAFILDIFIFYHLLRYMGKYQTTPFARKNFAALCIGSFLAYTALLYFFQVQGYDTPTGSNSAYMLNIIISWLYVLQFYREDMIAKMSYTIAWCKLLGNMAYSAFIFSYFPNNYFCQILCVGCFVFDLIYLYLFIQRRKSLGQGIF
jgi:hypothetical protein